MLSDTDGRTVGIGGVDGPAQVNLDTGFTAGLGVGYRFHPRFSAALAWEYRSEVALADGQRCADGNYASNVFYLNSYYHFESDSAWHPCIGAGLGWVQEIDIDLEGRGPEQSFSDAGALPSS